MKDISPTSALLAMQPPPPVQLVAAAILTKPLLTAAVAFDASPRLSYWPPAFIDRNSE